MEVISLKRSRRELPRQELGPVPSSGLLVSTTTDSFNYLSTDHAHPTFVAGHPFKGGWVSSSGFLLHPEMKRFQIMSPILFAPPNPAKVAGVATAVATVPTFSSFFSTYFGSANYNSDNTACGKMMAGLRRCYETNAGANPLSACQYYVDGFKRLHCSN